MKSKRYSNLNAQIFNTFWGGLSIIPVVEILDVSGYEEENGLREENRPD
jgi:hypothetical protein